MSPSHRLCRRVVVKQSGADNQLPSALLFAVFYMFIIAVTHSDILNSEDMQQCLRPT
jgi:hypothetical protein